MSRWMSTKKPPQVLLMKNCKLHNTKVLFLITTIITTNVYYTQHWKATKLSSLRLYHLLSRSMLPPPVAAVKTPFVKHIKERENSTMQKKLFNKIGPIWTASLEQWINNMQPQEQSCPEISNQRTYAKEYMKTLPSTESTLNRIFSSWTSITGTWLVEILTMTYHDQPT